MAKVLVVDDSPVDRRLAGNLLEKRPGLTALDKQTGLTALYAENGREALSILEREQPDLVLTDLQMPVLNGLELVEEIRDKFPLVPVVLMTAHGSEDIAVRALQQGAASYVPKRNLAHDLLETIETVLAAATAERGQQRLLECLARTESEFLLDNDPALITPLLGHVRESLRRLKFTDETGLIRITIAIGEAVLNAIYHGNLEVDAELRERNEKAFRQMVEERRRQSPYRQRRVRVLTWESLTEARYVVRDEGPGFDPTNLPDPTDPANLDRTTGRGLLLIHTFMDEVYHNERANEITLIKRRFPVSH